VHKNFGWKPEVKRELGRTRLIWAAFTEVNLKE
jgi:hypothetical protein